LDAATRKQLIELQERRRREVKVLDRPDSKMTTTHSSESLQERLQRDLERRRAEMEAKRAEEERLRKELGVNCLRCRDTGTVEGRFCSCDIGYGLRVDAARTEFLADLDEHLGIPLRFRGLTFDTYPNQKSPQLKQLREWVERFDGKRGLFITGGFGRGKSVLLCDALRRLVTAEAERRSFEIEREPHYLARFKLDSYGPLAKRLGCFRTATGLLQSLRPNDSNRMPYGGANEDVLRTYQRIPYLAIDDLGAERLTAWGADRLFEIVNERHNELRPILLSSNLTLNQLAAKWNDQVGDGESGERIINRLIESCDVIVFPADAPNWRLRKEAA